MTHPDFGPDNGRPSMNDYMWQDGHNDVIADDARAERNHLRREAAADAKELRETGWDAAGERAAEFEAEVRGGLL